MILPGYDAWKLQASPVDDGPVFTYDLALDDMICDYCGKPQATNGPGCVRCDNNGKRDSK